MIRTIARQECRRFLRRPALRWLVLITWILAALALWSGGRQVQQEQRIYQQVQQRQQQLWESQGALNPHTVAHHGRYAFKPQDDLSAWDPGLSAYLGTALFLEAHKQNFEQYRSAQDQVRFSRFANLSLATLFQYLWPLLIILIGYALVADERSQGTLRLIWVQGVTPLRLFWGKALALNTLLAVISLPVLLAGLLLFGLSESFSWGAFGLFLLTYLLYWQIFIGLSLLLSACLPSSQQALMVLLGIWFLSTLVVPRAGLGWLQVMDPLPTAGQFRQAIQQDLDALPDWESRLNQLSQELLTAHKLQIAELPLNLEGWVLSQSEAEETAIYAQHFDALYQRYAADSHRYHQLGWLFPTLAVQSLSQALAGTDFAAHQNFLSAAEAYRFEFVQQLNQDIASQSDREAFAYLADHSLWSQIKAFEHQPLPLAERLWQQRPALLSLLGWCFVLGVLIPGLIPRMAVLP